MSSTERSERSERVRSKRLSDQLADGIDRQAGEAADDGAVDADELEVAADLQLDAPGRVGGVALVVLHHVTGEALHPAVDLALQVGVAGKAGAGPGQSVVEAAAQLAV